LQKCSFGTCQRSKHTKQKGGWLCLWHQLTPTRAAKVGVHKLENMAGTRLIRAIRQPYPLGWSLFACVEILPKQYITTYEGYLYRNSFRFVFPCIYCCENCTSHVLSKSTNQASWLIWKVHCMYSFHSMNRFKKVTIHLTFQ
jgi:hypothetical protein